MPLEKIIRKIEKDADKEVERIIGEAEGKAKQILSEGASEAQGLIEKMKVAHEKSVDSMKKKRLSAARREVRHIIMKAREDVISLCFTQAMEELKTLKKDKYQGIVANLITRGKPLLKQAVVVPTRDTDKKVTRELGMELADDTVSAMGGVVLREKDGSMELDNTFEGILERKKDDIRIRVSQALFK